MAAINIPPTAPTWLAPVLASLQRWVLALLDAPFAMKQYKKGHLPDATKYYGAMIFVTDDAAGPLPCYSNGTNWLHFYNNAVVS